MEPVGDRVEARRVQRRREAEQLWADLLAGAVRPGPGSGRRSARAESSGRRPPVVLARPGGPVATLWPYSQVLHAAVLLGGLRGDLGAARVLGRGLAAYRVGPAYASQRRPRIGPRFYDDNAWVGLAAAQAVALGGGAGVLGAARRLAAWTASGEDPRGGVRWRVGRDSRHACSTGSTAVLTLRAAGAGATVSTEAVAFGLRCRSFLSDVLGRADGLVADAVDRRGRVEPTAWSYNQGLAVGLDVLLSRAGVAGALDRARALAERATEHFDADDRLWRQPPSFVAVWARMLLLLASADGDPRWPAVVDAYLDRALAEGRAADGSLTAGGIGSYGRERTLDLAGLVQVAALRASDPATYAQLC